MANEKVSKAQPSRKGKKAWRKNVDMKSIDKGLDSMRREERVHGKTGPLKDDQLFAIDTVGDVKVRRQLAREKPLKIDQILAERSAVPATRSKVTADRSAADKQAELKKIERLAKRKLTNAPTPAAKKKKEQAYDMWAEETVEEVNDYLEPIKVRKVKAPSTLAKKPEAALHQPAVVVPAAGASYNPTQEEHQDLLKKAHEVEVQKIEERKKLDEQMQYRKELENLAHELQQEEDEAAENEVKDEKDEAAEDDEDKEQVEDRKTRVQRNKERRLRREYVMNQQKNHEKSIRLQVDKLNRIEEELAKRQEVLNKIEEQRREKAEEEKKQGLKRLGKHYVQEMPIEVQLQDELSESLRQLKPEGNVFKDRFVSLQKRNIIEPRLPVAAHRRYKLKEYEKRSYKNFDAMQDRK
ncbi:hypothetical protein DFQ28_000926 [Apophysomyces sp. BC1034]|nr:hypothetical protein DFQ30_008790 [Apophysomyces sp. BC1015]KAG0183350.1 hypothetical protein DFQ29_006919 [Apophysomyces sp. BC1021]KAG0194207.1 hypothetical protein DFQ28_000926 [Apophysomyces sp. BC1034]